MKYRIHLIATRLWDLGIFPSLMERIRDWSWGAWYDRCEKEDRQVSKKLK